MKRRNFLRNVGATIVINTALFPHISRLFKLERDGCWLRRESNLWTYEPPPRVATAGCTILSRTISSVEDKRISVSNSQFARALPAGLTWNCLRVGIRHIMTNSGGNLSSTQVMRVGLCSGQTNLPLDSSTTNFLGAGFDTATWSYNVAAGGNGAYYGAFSSTLFPIKKVATTTTKGTYFSGSFYTMCDATTANRSMLCVDMTKGSPNYTLYAFARSSIGNGDMTGDQFLQQMTYGAPSFTGHSYSGPKTLAFDEVAGALDNAVFAWDRSDATWEISDLAICKFS